MTDQPQPPPSPPSPSPSSPPPPSGEPDLPEAVVAHHSRLLPELVWAIPIVAVLVGGWLAVNAIRARGPTITISFRDAAGLEPGKTKLKYRDVDVGEVRSIGFSPDRSTVVVRAQLRREAAPWMVEDTHFWVVRARVAAGEISGLETLLSGSYIGLDVGASRRERHDFKGLDAAPVVSGGTPGRAFVAHAARSIGIGLPVFFRHMRVGQVTSSDLEQDGSRVSIGLFVHAPYDRYVTTATRFWEASGIDVTLDTGGLKVDTESLATLLIGGVSFESGPDGRGAPVAPPNHLFILYPSRDEAMKQPDTEFEDYTLVFRQSVRGLAVGAPVDFRGVLLGEVTRIGVDYDPVHLTYTTPVDVRVFPGRLRARFRHAVPEESPETAKARMRRLIDRGLRAQLRTTSLLTSQLFVAVDFFPAAPPPRLDPVRYPLEIPTVPSDVDDLRASLADLAKKVDRLPLDQVGEIIGDARRILAKAGGVFTSADSVLKQFGPTSQRQADLDEIFRQVTRAARSVRALADSLERHPESLLRGRKRESR